MKITRKEVYKIINGERKYQKQQQERLAHIHTNTDYLVYIQHCVKRAFEAMTSQNGDQSISLALRKIAALAVGAMEENGIQPRERII